MSSMSFTARLSSDVVSDGPPAGNTKKYETAIHLERNRPVFGSSTEGPDDNATQKYLELLSWDA